jgi:hypothetical protein
MLLKIPSGWMAALVLPLIWGGAACQDFPTKPGDGGVADGREKDAPVGMGGSASGGSQPGNGGQPGSGGSTGSGGAPDRESDGGTVDAPVAAVDALADAGAPDVGPPPECTPGMNQCNGPQPQACGSTSKWQNAGAACPFVCSTSTGTCVGTCTPGAKQCNLLQPQSCDAEGSWQNAGAPVRPERCSATAASRRSVMRRTCGKMRGRRVRSSALLRPARAQALVSPARSSAVPRSLKPAM